MATIRVRPDFNGYRQTLLSAGVRQAIDGLAADVASNVAAQGLTASSGSSNSGPNIVGVVESYTTDRVAASVTIQHPAGLAMQARHGVLTKAATAAGLEVRST